MKSLRNPRRWLRRLGTLLVPQRNGFRRVQCFQGESLLHREQPGALADQQQMRRAFHDALGQGGDMANVLHTGNAPATQRLSFHDARIQ